jgi:hypothetical protein
MNTITIERLTQNKNGKIKHTINLTAENGTDYVQRQITLKELWKLEISCSNAGYSWEIIADETIGDSALYNKTIWTK